MLEVPGTLTAAWSALPRDVRARVEAYLAPDAAVRAAVADEAIPEPFAADLARGGGGLRAAFPRLARRLVAIAPGERITVRVACDGVHDGDFYGCLRASGRRVRFEERHELAIDGREVSHRVAIDLRAIVRQLAGPRGANPVERAAAAVLQ